MVILTAVLMEYVLEKDVSVIQDLLAMDSHASV